MDCVRYNYFKITFNFFLDDEAVKHRLLRCVLERNISQMQWYVDSNLRTSCYCFQYSSAASQSSRLPEDLETCSSIPSLASSFIVDSDVSPICVADDPRSAGQGILTSSPSRSVFAKADIYCYAKLIPANVS